MKGRTVTYLAMGLISVALLAACANLAPWDAIEQEAGPAGGPSATVETGATEGGGAGAARGRP